jgi:DNA-binding NarL/FixJ family response regulator
MSTQRSDAADAALPMAVLVVDDEPSVTRGIQLALRRSPFEVAAANSAASAIELLRARRIDVVVSDERMPGMSGTEFLIRVRTEFPETARILLTGQATLDVATRAINEGKIAFLLQKPCPPDRLQDAIARAFAEHRRSAPGFSLHAIAQGFSRADFQRLTKREEEVLRLVVDGHRLRQIAKALFISEHTVRNHLKVIFRKLDVHSQSELMRKGRESISGQPAEK